MHLQRPAGWRKQAASLFTLPDTSLVLSRATPRTHFLETFPETIVNEQRGPPGTNKGGPEDRSKAKATQLII